MITLHEVKIKIQEEHINMQEADKPSKKSAAKNRWQRYRLIEAYLESAPNEEYLRSKLKELRKKQIQIMNRYSPNEKLMKSEETKQRREFEKTYDIPNIRKQINALQFIVK